MTKGFARTGKGEWIVGEIDTNYEGRRTVDDKTKCQNCGEYNCVDGNLHCSDECADLAIAELNSML